MPVFRRWNHYYQQRPLRFTDNTLSTTAIDDTDPISVAYAPGGTRWRQTYSARIARRDWPDAPYFHRVFTPGAATATISWTEANDTLAATGTAALAPNPTNQPVTEAQRVAFRPALHRAYFAQPRKLIGPAPANATLAWTEADDTVAATGTVTEAPTPTQRRVIDTQRAAYRPAGRPPQQRQARTVSAPGATGTITWTEGDDTLAASGTVAGLPPGLRQQQANAAARWRPGPRQPYCQRLPRIDQSVATVFVDGDSGNRQRSNRPALIRFPPRQLWAQRPRLAAVVEVTFGGTATATLVWHDGATATIITADTATATLIWNDGATATMEGS